MKKPYPSGSAKVVLAVALRPKLWKTALRFCPSWRHPLPPRDYVHFRTVTMYGGEGDYVIVKDAIQFLKWAKESGDKYRETIGGTLVHNT